MAKGGTFANAVLKRKRPVGYSAKATEVCCLAKFDPVDFKRGVEFARHRALDAATVQTSPRKTHLLTNCQT